LDGFSHGVDQPNPTPACLGVAVFGLATFLLLGLTGIVACFVGSQAAWACITLASYKITGQAGDVLGANAIITEIAKKMTIFPFHAKYTLKLNLPGF